MLRNILKSNINFAIPVIIVLLTKMAILLAISILSVFLYPDSRVSNLNIWELWNVWDAPHFLSIAQYGYQTKGVEANFIVFLPLFPLMIFIFKNVFQINYLMSSYAVSFLASVLIAVLLYKLTILDFSKKIATYTVFLFFVFPTSFFLHIPYTESLFILLCILTLYFIRKKYFWFAFLSTGFATFTRLAGLALIPAILFEIMINKELDTNKKLRYSIIGTILSTSGFLLYLLLNYLLWGNFFQFSIFEKQNWYTHFTPFGEGLKAAISSLSWRTGVERLMLGYGQIIAFAFGLIMSTYVLFKIRISYGIFMLGILWLSFVMSFWLSMPRYVLSMFPAFMVLALFSKQIIFRYFWLLFSISLLIIFSLTFIQYGPVF